MLQKYFKFIKLYILLQTLIFGMVAISGSYEEELIESAPQRTWTLRANWCFDCRPTYKDAGDSETNCVAMIAGLACLPVSMVWRTVTCPWQESMNCFDVLCARMCYCWDGNYEGPSSTQLTAPRISLYSSPPSSRDTEPYLAGGSYHDDLDNRLKSESRLSKWMSENTSSSVNEIKNYSATIRTENGSVYKLTKEEATKLVNDIKTGRFNILCNPHVDKISA